MLVRSAAYREWASGPGASILQNGRSGTSRRLPWLRLSLGSAVLVFGLVQLAGTDLRQAAVETAPSPVRPAVLTAPPSGWEPISPSAPLFALQAPALDRLPPFFEARRHAGGGREDKLVFGVFESEALHFRLALFHGGPDPKARSGFYLDMARRAGDAGLSLARSALPSVVATKLGPVEIAEAVLADSFERECLAFRFQRTAPDVSGHGWYCTPPASEPDRRDLACLIDRLTFLPHPDAQALRALLGEADRQKGERCETRPPGRSKATSSKAT